MIVVTFASLVRRSPLLRLTARAIALAFVGLALLKVGVSLQSHLPQSAMAGLIVIVAFAVVEVLLLTTMQRIFNTVP